MTLWYIPALEHRWTMIYLSAHGCHWDWTLPDRDYDPPFILKQPPVPFIYSMPTGMFVALSARAASAQFPASALIMNFANPKKNLCFDAVVTFTKCARPAKLGTLPPNFVCTSLQSLHGSGDTSAITCNPGRFPTEYGSSLKGSISWALFTLKPLIIAASEQSI